MIEFISELWQFLKLRKKTWLAPLIFIMIILGGLIILAEGLSNLKCLILKNKKIIIKYLLIFKSSENTRHGIY